MAADSAVRRRYFLRVGISMAVYVVSLLAADYLIEDMQIGGATAYALALVPGLAVVGMFYAMGRFMLELTDEFMRMLAVRQQMIAAGFALSVAVVWGFLEEFLLVPHAEAYWIVVVWALGTFVGALSNRITHGSWGECW